MGRINAVLDEEVDYGFEGGPRYKTDMAELANGFSERNSAWDYSRHEYSASFGDIQDEERDKIIAVFHACRGARHSFKFKDWNDYTITDQNIVVVPGTTDTIQLYKVYAPFGPTYKTVRPIQAFKYAIIVDETDTEVAGYLNENTGEFTPSSNWGAGQHRILDAEFYVWVRFEDDYNPMTINAWQNNNASVTLVEDLFEFMATNVPSSWEE